MEEEKSWIEKIGENLEGGRVNLTKKDKEKILDSYYEHEKSLAQKIRESEFFIYGILFAILGSYLATWIYEAVNGVPSWKAFNFIILLVFLLVLFKFWSRLHEEKSHIKFSKDSLERWKKADYIKYGRATRGLNKKEFKEMKKEMKLAKDDKERKEIHDKYFYPKEKGK